jgi:hypothetical protein
VSHEVHHLPQLLAATRDGIQDARSRDGGFGVFVPARCVGGDSSPFEDFRVRAAVRRGSSGMDRRQVAPGDAERNAVISSRV